MTVWLVLAGLTVAVMAVLLWPLLRRRGGRADATADYDIEVYRAQLTELENDLARGLIDETEAAASRLEIQRRMLAADSARDADREPAQATSRRLAAGLLSVGLPAVAFGLYVWLGAPGVPGVPFAERAAERSLSAQADQVPPEVHAMVARLTERLKDEPDDFDGWVMLGRSSMVLQRYTDAADAYGRAAALNGKQAELHSAQGEALVMAANGQVTMAAMAAFERAIARDAGEPRARFFMGLALDQQGDRQGALDAWTALAADAPPDAPWLPGLRQHIAALGGGAGETQSAPSAPSEPSALAADDEQMAQIQGMVGRLAARMEDEPENTEGWRMLGRSYAVLGRPADAAEAYGKAAALLPDDVDAQLEYAGALIAMQTGDGPLPDAFLAAVRRVAELEPGNRNALYFLGEAARRSGDVDAARRHWQALLEAVAGDAAESAQVRRMLDGLTAAQ